MRSLVTLMLILLLATPAAAQETTAAPTIDPAIGRALERDPGIQCHQAIDAHRYEDAEDYCRQAATLDAADTATKSPSNDMYPVTLSDEAWDQYDTAFSVLALTLQREVKPDATTLRRNYKYALTFLVPCSTNAAKAVAGAKTEKQRALLGKAAVQVKYLCDGLAKTIRSLAAHERD
jgi:hypothetical protein